MKDLICTDQIASTDNGIRYKVYKNSETEKYFIKRFNGIFEITILKDGSRWNPCFPLTGDGGIIKNAKEKNNEP